ncbi:MAG: hypothetical protein WCW84_14125 [Sulfurimonas sp.]|jgi:hypothetical protein
MDNQNMPIKNSSEKIDEVEKIKQTIESTEKIVGDVDNISKIISSTLSMRDDIAIDLQNYSLFSIPQFKNVK